MHVLCPKGFGLLQSSARCDIGQWACTEVMHAMDGAGLHIMHVFVGDDTK